MKKGVCVVIWAVMCLVKANVAPTDAQTGPTIPPSTGYGYSLERTALVTCGASLYPDSIYPIVFPPTEATKEMVDQAPNITIAKEWVGQQLDLFCSHISNYSTCLKEKLTSGNSVHGDQVLALFVDGNTIPAALDTFCENKDLILSNFECTYESLKKGPPCKGGIIDILQTIIAEMNYRSGVFGYTCKDIKPSIECRIQNQLKPCNAQFANVMSDVIKGMLQDDCEEGRKIEPIASSMKMAPCFLEYTTDIEQRVRNGGAMNTTSKQAKFLVDMMTSFCSKYAADMIPCAFERSKASTKTVDIMFRKVTSEENLKAIVAYGCSKVPLFAKHSTCVWTSFGKYFSGSETCYKSFVEKYLNEISVIVSNSTLDMDRLQDTICSLMDDFGKCMAPAFTGCDSELGDAFSRFVTYNLRTCRDPTYVVPTVSSATRTLPVLSTIVAVILTAVTG